MGWIEVSGVDEAIARLKADRKGGSMEKLTGQELIDRWITFVRRYAFVSDAQGLVLALWAVHTWIFEKFGATPYLEVYAPNRGMGKTRVLEVLQLLVRGAELQPTARIASIVRLIAEHQGKSTFLIDEAEKLGQGAINETRSALAAGYRKGSTHPIVTAQGVVRYPTFCPKAFALIGNIQPILRDRGIPILLQRGKPQADLLAEYGQAKEVAEQLKTDLFKFAQQTGAFAHPPQEMPEWLYGRNAEIWTPIFSIAQAMSLHKATMDLLVAASVDMSALKELEPLPNKPGVDADAADIELQAAERVMADVQRVMADGADIQTEDLLARLRAIPTAPWRSWRGKGLDAISLAALLSRYGLQPKPIRFGKGRKNSEVKRGYRAAEVKAVKL